MSTLVSVIMPAYNAAEFLQKSIDSVIAQTYPDWELIIVDDGSTDQTAEIIKNNLGKDSRIKSFFQKNGRQGKARNLAIQHARGEYLAFLDADDDWLPGKLEIQLAEIVEKNADLVYSDCFIFTDAITDEGKRYNNLKGRMEGRDGLIQLLEGNPIPILTVLAKADKVRLVGGFTEKPEIQNAEDYHLWVNLLINGAVFFGSEKVLANYRIHPLSASAGDRSVSKQAIEMFIDLGMKNSEFNALVIRSLAKKIDSTAQQSEKELTELKRYNRQLKEKTENHKHAFLFRVIRKLSGIKQRVFPKKK